MLQRARVRWYKVATILTLIIVLAMLPAASAFAQEPMTVSDEDAEAVTQLVDDILAAFLAADPDALEPLLSENFVTIETSGEMVTRDAWLELAGTGILSKLEAGELSMTPVGPDDVLVVFNLDGSGEWEGEEFAFFEIDSLLVHRGEDGWVATFNQGTDRMAETDAYRSGVMRDELFATLPTVTIDVSEDGIVVPEEVPAGPTVVELTNSAGTTLEDGSPLVAEIARLAEGATLEDLLPLLAEAQDNPGPALEIAKIYGSPFVPAGRIILDLQPGQYVAVTLEGEPVAQEFTVTGTDDADDAGAADEAGEGMVEVEAEVEVQLLDFTFVMPDTIPAGMHLWEITNAGEQWHEIAVVQLPEGMTVEDLLDMFAGGPPGEDGAPPEGEEGSSEGAAEATASESISDTADMTDTAEVGAEGDEAAGPPGDEMPFDMLFGYGPISEGNTAYIEVDLAPGEYTVICFLPDLLGDMSPHAAHGMIRTLIVE